MNHKLSGKPAISETTTVSRLLNEFSELVRRQKEERKKTVATKAASAFFEKDVLTIFDFFEPIGNVLRVPVKPAKETIGDFLRQSLASRTMPKKEITSRFISPKIAPQTIRNFFERL